MTKKINIRAEDIIMLFVMMITIVVGIAWLNGTSTLLSIMG